MIETRATVVYPKPPIVEAVIDFQFSEQAPMSLLDKAAAKFEHIYSSADHDLEFEFSSQFRRDNPKPQTSTRSRKIGVRMKSADQTEILLLRVAGFTVAQLAPYPGWESLRERAHRDWRIWKRVAGHRKISRVGVRFVNRVDIPLALALAEDAKPSDFFTLYPHMPEIGPPEVFSYTMQVSKPIGDGLFAMNLATSIVAQSPVPETMGVLLDIDVFLKDDFPIKEDDFWAVVESFRDKKNSIFEACITQKTRELFQ